MVVCIRVRAPRRDWVLFRSIVSQTNGVHVVSSEDIMFSQTGRTNRKWTAVSFTLRDKYGLSRRRWCSAPIIPAVSASSFQHRKSFDSSRSERETVRATVFRRFYSPLPFPPPNIIRSLCEEIFDLWWKEMETISSSPHFWKKSVSFRKKIYFGDERGWECSEYEYFSKIFFY